MKAFRLLACVCCLVGGLFFLNRGAAAEEKTVIVRAGQMLDVVGGQVLSDQRIIIHSDRIASIEPWPNDGVVPDIDWSGKSVLPGLIDSHTHLLGDIQSVDVLAPIKATPDDDLRLGRRHALATLRAGFTTVIDVGSYRAFTDVTLRDEIRSGTTIGPRMLVAGAYVTVPGGGGEVVGLGSQVAIPDAFRVGVAKGPDEVRAVVANLISGDVDFIKMIATGAVLTMGTEPGSPEFYEDEIRAAVEEAAKAGKYVTAHAHGAEGVKMAIRAGVRSIQHASIIDDEGLAMAKAHGTWLVMDVYNGDYIKEVGERDGWPEDILRKNNETTDTQRQAFSKAVRMGVNLAFGTDAGVYPHGDNARQFAYMVRLGMTPMQAIESATIQAARAMSVDDEVGSIQPGKVADLIAVEGDVLADISRLEAQPDVMFGGRLVADVPARPIDVQSLEAEVATVERAFAQSMADRDFQAFKQFIDDEAVFWGTGALRGKQAVLDAWQSYFEGQDAPFAWEPETVLVLPSGDLGLSTGPVWTPDGTIVAYYHSTWRKNDQGEWKIVFDKGQRYCSAK